MVRATLDTDGVFVNYIVAFKLSLIHSFVRMPLRINSTIERVIKHIDTIFYVQMALMRRIFLLSAVSEKNIRKRIIRAKML